MKVQVLFFAGAREQVGVGALAQKLPDGATVGDLAERLFAVYPALRKARLRFAVNAAYAESDAALHDGDEVACIPPVGGG